MNKWIDGIASSTFPDFRFISVVSMNLYVRLTREWVWSFTAWLNQWKSVWFYIHAWSITQLINYTGQIRQKQNKSAKQANAINTTSTLIFLWFCMRGIMRRSNSLATDFQWIQNNARCRHRVAFRGTKSPSECVWSAPAIDSAAVWPFCQKTNCSRRRAAGTLAWPTCCNSIQLYSVLFTGGRSHWNVFFFFFFTRVVIWFSQQPCEILYAGL